MACQNDRPQCLALFFLSSWMRPKNDSDELIGKLGVDKMPEKECEQEEKAHCNE